MAAGQDYGAYPGGQGKGMDGQDYGDQPDGAPQPSAAINATTSLGKGKGLPVSNATLGKGAGPDGHLNLATVEHHLPAINSSTSGKGKGAPLGKGKGPDGPRLSAANSSALGNGKGHPAALGKEIGPGGEDYSDQATDEQPQLLPGSASSVGKGKGPGGQDYSGQASAVELGSGGQGKGGRPSNQDYSDAAASGAAVDGKTNGTAGEDR